MSCTNWKIAIALALICSGGAVSAGNTQSSEGSPSSSVIPEYFPSGVFAVSEDTGDYRSAWYACILAGLKEPSLFDLRSKEATEVYRFLWLPSFHHPISVRVVIKSDGSGSVVARSLDENGGLLAAKKGEKNTLHASGTLTLDTVNGVSTIQLTSLLKRLKDSEFWSMSTEELRATAEERQVTKDEPTTVPLPPVDGARWILEGVRNGEYHVVDRWSPRDDVYARLCKYFLMLGKVGEKNIY